MKFEDLRASMFDDLLDCFEPKTQKQKEFMRKYERNLKLRAYAIAILLVIMALSAGLLLYSISIKEEYTSYFNNVFLYGVLPSSVFGLLLYFFTLYFAPDEEEILLFLEQEWETPEMKEALVKLDKKSMRDKILQRF